MVSIGLRQFIISGLISGTLISHPVQASTSTQTECVILLHGLARTSRSMHKIKKALENDYLVVSKTYPSREQTIEKLAEVAITSSISKCGNAARVNFVTHSLGGILVRQYLRSNHLDRIGRVVMLGPPNQGSELVDFFNDYRFYTVVNGPAGLQLGTGPDSVPQRLGPVNFDLGVIAGDRSYNLFYSRIIGSANDGKVSVESSKVGGMQDHLVLPVSHTFMMRDRSVIKQIKNYLRDGTFLRD